MTEADVRSSPTRGGNPPPKPPSGPPGHQPPHGPGGGGFWTSRPAHAVLLILLVISALAAPTAIVGMIHGIIQRPLTGVLASMAVFVAAYRNRRLFIADADTYCGRLVYTGIASGMAGEALTYLVFSVPPGAPTSALWVALFIVGIGGAIGVGFGVAGLMLTGGLVTARLVPSVARELFGRHA